MVCLNRIECITLLKHTTPRFASPSNTSASQESLTKMQTASWPAASGTVDFSSRLSKKFNSIPVFFALPNESMSYYSSIVKNELDLTRFRRGKQAYR